MELLTIFWQSPCKNQIATELGDGVILIKDANTDEPIGMEILSYHPNANRFDTVSVEFRQLAEVVSSSPKASSRGTGAVDAVAARNQKDLLTEKF